MYSCTSRGLLVAGTMSRARPSSSMRALTVFRRREERTTTIAGMDSVAGITLSEVLERGKGGAF